jgi:hypothetical protein
MSEGAAPATRPVPRAVVRVALLLLIVAAAISLIHACRGALGPRGSLDFGAPLKAAQTLFHEEPYSRALAGSYVAPTRFDPNRNPWPAWPVQVPSVLMLFWPFAFLGWPAAKLAWLASNLLFTGGILLMLFRRFLPGRAPALYVAVTCLFLTSVFHRAVLANGQHILAGLFFFLLALELGDRRRPWLAGFALAAALIKYSVIVFLLPWLILTRQWLALAVALALHAAMTLGVAWWIGADPVRMILDSLRLSESLVFSGMIDLSALAGKVGIPLRFAMLLAAAISALILWIAAARRVADGPMFLAALCLFSVLLAYHRGYDFVVTLVPVIVAIARWPQARSFGLLMAGAVAVTWYGYALLSALGIDVHGAYAWVMAAFCYPAAATALWMSVGKQARLA